MLPALHSFKLDLKGFGLIRHCPYIKLNLLHLNGLRKVAKFKILHLMIYPRRGNYLAALSIEGMQRLDTVRLSGYAFSKLSGSEAGIMLMSEIPISVLLGSLLYGEIPTLLESLGGVLVIAAGIVVTIRSSCSKNRSCYGKCALESI